MSKKLVIKTPITNASEDYLLNLPDKNSGKYTIATTADIPAVSLTTTAGSEVITVGSNTLNVVTRDTAQTITGIKSFENSGASLEVSGSRIY